ncbi:phytolongin Phyl1.1-like [Phalaenopsis equestris]|uniref:phytolongin Phyl1.1-like n=1 Tax=Phalaenopsis equestris TaxID=78828 RepID=UPI0009E360EF|nr:phytolongin Phyl1.1-like [Phalaenopsis equestris]XP_020585712.1 phytolongin Phyl1.1-like [Phalaenopsis equestris]XP_020585713.1 phytolongin Phyl1.1-like [Phalaenopsis equestris]XP_020585714.1 phytolongin Phyl1.1-like [Phalaenopsis equestris]
MDGSMGISILFCSISKANRILYSHSLDRNLESLAFAALQSAPSFHSFYSHTAGDRTFAFLFDEGGHTYFAIAERSASLLRFLELMRDRFRNSVNEDRLVSIVHNSPSSALMKTAEAPLLIRSVGDEEGMGSPGEMWIEMPVEPAGPMPLQKSLSARAWMQQNGRRLWWRHVKILVAIDLLLCLVLFLIWLAVCRGFQCIA